MKGLICFWICSGTEKYLEAERWGASLETASRGAGLTLGVVIEMATNELTQAIGEEEREFGVEPDMEKERKESVTLGSGSQEESTEEW